MNLAWRFISQTNTSVFLTGKAGTGKTTFLRRLHELTPKRMVVLAPTGVAAINAQGQTIHSFFQLPLGPLVPGEANTERKKHFRMSQDKKNLIRTLDLLIIDEISMVRADLLDAIDEEMRKYRDRNKPFGGVQLLLIGDLQQLPPVTKEGEWQLLAPYYATPWFYASHALQQVKYVTIELRHIYRQQDLKFIDILAKIRTGRIDNDTLSLLNTRHNPQFQPPTDEDWIRLTTHNRMAQDYNDRQLAALTTPFRTFQARIQRNFPESSYPADKSLTLKVGAQVMFIKNDPTGAHAYYNGKIGIVHEFSDEGIVIYCKEDDSYIGVEPVTWENTKYTIDPETQNIREEIEGTFTQYPLRLAWAITVHKSQGLTFQHAVLDINQSFAHGQAYVALSRCRTLEGLVLSRPVTLSSIITDNEINHYMQEQTEVVSPTLCSQLPQMSYDYYASLLDELFDFTPLHHAVARLTRVVEEHLASQQGRLEQSLHNAGSRLKEELCDITPRFQSQYRQLMTQAPNQYFENCTPLQERLQAAINYFGPKLTDIFLPVFDTTAIHIDNKAIGTKYNNALDDLQAQYNLKQGLFTHLTNTPITTSQYLTAKAQSLLAPQRKAPALSSTKEKSTKKSSGSGSSSAGGRQKGASRRHTLELFLSGMTPKEIAQTRELSISTVETHLSCFVATGELPLESIVSPEHQAQIRQAAKSFTRSYALAELRELLPKDISYLEIRCTLAAQEGNL